MIMFERPADVLTSMPIPGTPVTFLWQGEAWLGVTLHPDQLLALCSAGSHELRPKIFSWHNARQIRLCNESLMARLGHQERGLFVPPRAELGDATVLIDAHDQPWIRAEHQDYVTWINLESGRNNDLGLLRQNAKGMFNEWSLWRQSRERGELVAKQG